MTWCIAIFTTAADAAAIVGDLDEERLSIAARDGERAARRWYRRQVLATIGQLAVSPLRESPRLFLLLGLLGVAVMWLLFWGIDWLAGQLVVRVQVYRYVPATLFWSATSLVPLLVVATTISLVMGRRAMAGILTVVGALAVWVAVLDPLLLMSRLPDSRLPGVPEYMAQTIPIFLFHALLLIATTVVGVAMRQRCTRDGTTDGLALAKD
ncbi:MAG: hypothetical protein R2712_03180 [Vicinamibacterales bacterium]